MHVYIYMYIYVCVFCWSVGLVIGGLSVHVRPMLDETDARDGWSRRLDETIGAPSMAFHR